MKRARIPSSLILRPNVLHKAARVLNAIAQGEPVEEDALTRRLLEVVQQETAIPLDIVKHILSHLPVPTCWRVARSLCESLRVWAESVMVAYKIQVEHAGGTFGKIYVFRKNSPLIPRYITVKEPFGVDARRFRNNATFALYVDNKCAWCVEGYDYVSHDPKCPISVTFWTAGGKLRTPKEAGDSCEMAFFTFRLRGWGA